MRKLHIAEQALVAGGMFVGDAGFARVYFINGPNDSEGSDIRSNNNGGGSATVNYNPDGSVKSVQIQCPPGQSPVVTSGGGNVNGAVNLVNRVVGSGSVGVGGNGASISCK